MPSFGMWGFDVLRVGEGGDCIQGRSVNVSYELSTFFFLFCLKKPNNFNEDPSGKKCLERCSQKDIKALATGL